jgi:SPP1 family predicted phage head-tail adaptor
MKCCDLYGGLLRHRVALQRKTRAADGAGGFAVTWQTYATVKAQIITKAGRELVIADRLSATQTNRATIRYRADVNETDRIVYRGRAYQIRSVVNIEERNKWLELDLERGVAT